ncbi:hypothetical protein B6R96_10080 [Streptomyces sp. Sge12]|nr:hypothetical protein B6R96_10080 [Streptomyces sp. Sge12]
MTVRDCWNVTTPRRPPIRPWPPVSLRCAPPSPRTPRPCPRPLRTGPRPPRPGPAVRGRPRPRRAVSRCRRSPRRP